MKIAVLALVGAAALCAQPKAAGPALLPCGVHGDAEVICGTRTPEDLEITPDGKLMLVAQFGAGQTGTPGAISLFDPAKKTFSAINVTSAAERGWGDPGCTTPVDVSSAHGTSLIRRRDGKWQLLIVNHNTRESIEYFELKQNGANWGLVWHGCVTHEKAYNDVAAMADGGFVASHPQALQAPTGKGGGIAADFSGTATGYVARWIPGRGETELPGTRAGYPNGVSVSADERYLYFAAWTESEMHKYDLRESKEVQVVKLGFMPDNMTWTKGGQLLAAGIKGVRGNCPETSNVPCIQGFNVVAIKPSDMSVKTVADSNGRALISGVSAAMQFGDAIYIGAFSGDRMVKVSWKE